MGIIYKLCVNTCMLNHMAKTRESISPCQYRHFIDEDDEFIKETHNPIRFWSVLKQLCR